MEKVWQAWTNPSIIKLWFGSDPQGTVQNAYIDIFPGGRFEISFMDSDKTPHSCFGIYTDVNPYEKLTFTWSWKSEPGSVSIVSVTMKSEPGGTQMNFEHAYVNGSAHNYESGWKRTFEKLDRVLTEK
jgi:uncharacterized protein YndB with AHSA1/START domain